MFATRSYNRMWPLMALYHRPWPSSSAVAAHLDPSQLIEEEQTPYYDPNRFYPARLGQVLNERYQIATKLGYGSSSTVWLARDMNGWRWSKERYVAVKINASSHHSREKAAENELAIMKRISDANPQHKGWHFVRRLVDSFTIDGTSEKHLCFVFEPLREPLWLYCRRFIDGVIPPEILKVMLQMTLHGLDYLHAECEVIHTDLKPDNIMVKLEDPSIVERDAQDEYNHPLPQKHVDGRTIYLSRNNYGRISMSTGIIQIADFGLSVRGNTPNHGCIQADIYRAPEVILDAGYTYSADIWSLGAMLWDLIEGKALFETPESKQSQDHDERLHLAQITALLGPPPAGLLTTGRRTSLFYHTDGVFKHPELAPQDSNFENTLLKIQGEEKKMFIEFVKKMLKWSPEERSTAKELLSDPWLYTDFSQNES